MIRFLPLPVAFTCMGIGLTVLPRVPWWLLVIEWGSIGGIWLCAGILWLTSVNRGASMETQDRPPE